MPQKMLDGIPEITCYIDSFPNPDDLPVCCSSDFNILNDPDSLIKIKCISGDLQDLGSNFVSDSSSIFSLVSGSLVLLGVGLAIKSVLN